MRRVLLLLVVFGQWRVVCWDRRAERAEQKASAWARWVDSRLPLLER